MRFRPTDKNAQVSVRDRLTGSISSPGAEPDGPTYDDGYRDGYQACEKRLQADIAALRQRLQLVEQRLPHELENAIASLQEQAGQTIVRMAFSLAELLVKRELDRDPLLLGIIDQALDMVPPMETPCLRLHPEDARLFTASATASLTQVEIKSDAGLRRGDVIVDCQDGFLDATMAARSAELRRLIEEQQSSGSVNDDSPA